MSLSNKRQKCDLVVVGEEETEIETKPETKPETETETETETEPETEPETKPQTETKLETETETKPETMKEAFIAATGIFKFLSDEEPQGIETILKDKGEVLKEAFGKYDFSPTVNGVLQGNKHLRIASYAACVFQGIKGKGKGLGRPEFSVCITPEKQSDTIPIETAREFNNEENSGGAGGDGGAGGAGGDGGDGGAGGDGGDGDGEAGAGEAGAGGDGDGEFIVGLDEFFGVPDVEYLRDVRGKGDTLKRFALARKFSDGVEEVLGDDEELRTFFYTVTVLWEGCW
jgi:hypothetical protein